MTMHLRLLSATDPMRAVVETGIRQVYAREYGATLGRLPPILAALIDGGGGLLSAAGLRFAEDGFFSEHYLDQRVETCLGRLCGRPVQREQIMEIGSMAGFRPATSLLLVDLVARHAMGDGLSWAVFTATARLRALLRRSGVVFAELAPASPRRVPDPGQWGSYYLHDPRVVAVEGSALPRFRRPAATVEAHHA